MPRHRGRRLHGQIVRITDSANPCCPSSACTLTVQPRYPQRRKERRAAMQRSYRFYYIVGIVSVACDALCPFIV